MTKSFLFLISSIQRYFDMPTYLKTEQKDNLLLSTFEVLFTKVADFTDDNVSKNWRRKMKILFEISKSKIIMID